MGGRGSSLKIPGHPLESGKVWKSATAWKSVRRRGKVRESMEKCGRAWESAGHHGEIAATVPARFCLLEVAASPESVHCVAWNGFFGVVKSRFGVWEWTTPRFGVWEWTTPRPTLGVVKSPIACKGFFRVVKSVRDLTSLPPVVWPFSAPRHSRGRHGRPSLPPP